MWTMRMKKENEMNRWMRNKVIHQKLENERNFRKGGFLFFSWSHLSNFAHINATTKDLYFQIQIITTKKIRRPR